jgi:hypothetical protein
MQLTAMLLTLAVDAVRFLRLCLRLRPTLALAAENLFLRKQLALYQERNAKPRRATDATRLALVWLSHCFDRRRALVIVTPQTFTRWHRQGFQRFWRWKSRLGRPCIPAELQAVIRQMARANPTWGQERIANKLLLKLGLCVSPRTVRKYLPKRLDPERRSHPHHCRCRFASTDTGFRSTCGWWCVRCWAGCIMTTGLRRRRRDHVATGVNTTGKCAEGIR